MKIKEIMTCDIITVKKDYTIRKLINILQKHRITGAPVIDDEGNLIGIVSVKDLVNAVAGLIKINLSADEIKQMGGKFNWVEGFMVKDVITADADDEVLNVFELMVEKHIHRVPIMKEGKMVGIISTTDAHKAILQYLKKLK